MNNNQLLLVLGILIWVVIWYMIAKIYFLVKLKNQRKNAVDRSRAVVMGQVNEKIAPLLPNFPYHYKDLTFLGKGIDYIVFDWLHRGYVREIILLEIKTGVSSLNKNEKAIKECVDNNRVSYRLLNLDR